MMCWFDRGNKHNNNGFIELHLLITLLLLILNPTSSMPNSSGVGCSSMIIVYPDCKELDLNATVPYPLYRDNSTISVVFVASPPTPKGWVAWGIKPKGYTMIGAEVILVFRSSNGVTVK
jgi:hypothetical protein